MKKIILTCSLFIFLLSGIAFAGSKNYTLLNRAVATGASSAVPVETSNKQTFQIKATSVSTGGTMKIQGSISGIDTDDWSDIATVTVSADGNTDVAVVGLGYKYMRANLTARTDGTYTVKLLDRAD